MSRLIYILTLLLAGGLSSAGWADDKETCRVNIVKCGHDYFRSDDGRPMIGSVFNINAFRLIKDSASGLWTPGQCLEKDLNADVDGDGRTDDDVVLYTPFSMGTQMNADSPWYDQRASSSRWFGGLVLMQGDRRDSFFTENGVNDETVNPHLAPRDNWTLFREVYDVNGPYRCYGLWLWKKSDFLGGGSKGRVTFDDQSRLALYLQRYWMGFEGGRWVVEDDDGFYISEETFFGAGQQPYYTNGKKHVLTPTATRWAKYNPAPPYHIDFDAARAEFKTHTFSDVRAVGWYIFKDRFIPAYTGFKWYSFEATALVGWSGKPAENVEMIRVEKTPEGVQPFYLAKTETPYVLWKDVFRRARSNTFALQRGFIFDRDGGMGSMELDDIEHRLDEPVTGLTLYDMAAWCNALSLSEGREPCYYEDASFTNVLQEVLNAAYLGAVKKPQKIFVKWSADGFRLPTAAEWISAADASGKSELGIQPSAVTASAGSGTPDKLGIYNLAGNVWEMAWAFGDVYDPEKSEKPVVLGGDFRYPARSEAVAATCGFRLLRRDAGLDAPAQDSPKSHVSRSFINEGSVSSDAGPSAKLSCIKIPGTGVEMASTEVPYSLWRRVRDRALIKGYHFDHAGSMGSMEWWGFADIQPSTVHQPSEPVTGISAYDAMVWCNALSEQEGLAPVYYEDQAQTRVLRKAFIYRPLMALDYEVPRVTNQLAWRQSITVKSDANGYRLPNRTEFEAAMKTGSSVPNRPQTVADIKGKVWMLETSEGGTHPVGSSVPNALGFYDLDGNVMEYGAYVEDRHGIQEAYGTSFIDPALCLGFTGAKRIPRGCGYPDLGFRVVRLVR